MYCQITSHMNQLKSEEYPAYYAPYIDTVVGNVWDVLTDQVESFPEFIASVPPGKAEYAYAEGKWTVKEVLGHVIDTERIMAYRALRFARNDTKALHSFNEEDFVAAGRFNERSLKSLAEEFVLVRKSNLALFERFNEQELSRRGMAGERLVSVRAFLYIIAGHLTYHRHIIRDRYLIDVARTL